ncbi:hypothetical protein L9F63_003289, partial [Diploptera punctata]
WNTRIQCCERIVRVACNMDVAVLLVVLLIHWKGATGALDTSQCIAPLGMESGAIRDEDITASSSFDSGNVGPQFGRIRSLNSVVFSS